MELILLAADVGKRWAAVTTLINLRLSQNAGYFRLRKLLLLKKDSGPSARRQVFVNTLRTGLLNCLNARSRGLTSRHRASCI